MRLVIDTNIIFSALIAGGKTRELIITAPVDLFVPEFFYTELDDHRDEIQAKTDLPQQDLTVLINFLFEFIRVIARDEFEDRLPDAWTHIAEVDPDDVPFLALALHLDAGVWSDDAHFHEQDAVDVWPTHELVDHMDLG